MCGRFINTNKINKLKKIFNINAELSSKNDIISYNIAPSQKVIVILNNKHLCIEGIYWGIKFFKMVPKKFYFYGRLYKQAGAFISRSP